MNDADELVKVYRLDDVGIGVQVVQTRQPWKLSSAPSPSRYHDSYTASCLFSNLQNFISFHQV